MQDNAELTIVCVCNRFLATGQ